MTISGSLARAHDERQSLGTLINEEALLLAKHLRNERQSWNPRLPIVLNQGRFSIKDKWGIESLSERTAPTRIEEEKQCR